MVYDEFSDDVKNTYAKMTAERGRYADDKFYKYSYMNIKTHWYDKEIWEKEKKIKRRYNVNPNSRKRKR